MSEAKCLTHLCPKRGNWRSGFCPACRVYHKRAGSLGAEWCVARREVIARWDERLTFIVGQTKKVVALRRKRHG